MSELKIDTEKAISCAVDIRNIYTKMEHKLSEISKAMNGIMSEYATTNAEELQKKYIKTEGHVLDLLSAIRGYSQFLEKSAKIYDEVERKIVEQVMDTAVKTISNSIDHSLGVFSKISNQVDEWK